MADNEKPEEKKEEKHQSTLESVISELKNFGKKAITIGAIAAMPFTYNLISPSHVANAQAFAYSLTAGRSTANVIQKKPALEGLVGEAARGTILSYPIAKAFEGVNQLESAVEASYGNMSAKSVKAGTWAFGVQPAVVTAHTAMTYGIGEKFRKYWWPSVRDVLLLLAIPSAANAVFLHKYGTLVQMAVAGTLSYIYGFIQAMRGEQGSIKNLAKALNPVPYISGGLTATGKLAKAVIYNPLKALYEISSGYTKKAAEPVKPQAPTAEAPAH